MASSGRALLSALVIVHQQHSSLILWVSTAHLLIIPYILQGTPLHPPRHPTVTKIIHLSTTSQHFPTNYHPSQDSPLNYTTRQPSPLTYITPDSIHHLIIPPPASLIRALNPRAIVEVFLNLLKNQHSYSKLANICAILAKLLEKLSEIGIRVQSLFHHLCNRHFKIVLCHVRAPLS